MRAASFSAWKWRINYGPNNKKDFERGQDALREAYRRGPPPSIWTATARVTSEKKDSDLKRHDEETVRTSQAVEFKVGLE